jgi:hypothetical protein
VYGKAVPLWEILPPGAMPYIDFSEDPPSRMCGAYIPVEWLIDHTPLDEPLLWWAELWGVEPRQSFESICRQTSPG